MQEFPEVQLVASIDVDLGHQGMELVEGARVPQIAEEVGELERANFPRPIFVEAFENAAHFLGLLLAEALAVQVGHHKVEKLGEVELEASILVYVAEDFLDVLRERRVPQFLQPRFQLRQRNAAAAILVELGEVGAGPVRAIFLQLFQCALPGLPSEYQELGEAQVLNLIALLRRRKNRLVQTLAADDEVLQGLSKVGDMQAEGQHQTIGQLIGRQPVVGRALQLRVEVEDLAELLRLDSGKALRAAVHLQKVRELLEAQLAVSVLVHRSECLLYHVVHGDEVELFEQWPQLVDVD
mmetsp:Transcript_8199/g.23458  ORF Transcript_8199/g.23458 Transcript_8199/m.23458 type:complete len:296 (+) Transcript_8199:939-1826(+)